jgi:hypothetical protein
MVIDIQRPRTRMIVAIALAVAIHEVVLSLMHVPSRPANSEEAAVTTKIVFETPRPTPRPTPTPKPTQPPTPPPRITPAPHVTVAAIAQVAGRAKGHPAPHRGGGARHAKAKAKKATTYANPKAAGAGTGTSTGQGSGDTPAVGGGLGGQGSGTSGNGNGSVNADTPCGFVDFAPYEAPRYRNGTAYEPIQAKVTFPDGHTQSEKFPYPWIYPDGEQNDPWSDTNLRKAQSQVRPGGEPPEALLQLPPPGADTSNYPSLIQYILSHTDANGYTVLKPCPKARG